MSNARQIIRDIATLYVGRLKFMVLTAACVAGLMAYLASPAKAEEGAQMTTVRAAQQGEVERDRAELAAYLATRMQAALEGEPYEVVCNDAGCTMTQRRWIEK